MKQSCSNAGKKGKPVALGLSTMMEYKSKPLLYRILKFKINEIIKNKYICCSNQRNWIVVCLMSCLLEFVK